MARSLARHALSFVVFKSYLHRVDLMQIKLVLRDAGFQKIFVNWVQIKINGILEISVDVFIMVSLSISARSIGGAVELSRVRSVAAPNPSATRSST